MDDGYQRNDVRWYSSQLFIKPCRSTGTRQRSGSRRHSTRSCQLETDEQRYYRHTNNQGIGRGRGRGRKQITGGSPLARTRYGLRSWAQTDAGNDNFPAPAIRGPDPGPSSAPPTSSRTGRAKRDGLRKTSISGTEKTNNPTAGKPSVAGGSKVPRMKCKGEGNNGKDKEG